MPAFNKTTIELIDIPDFDKIPDGLPKVIDSMSLAHSLGIRNRTMMHLITQREHMYKRTSIRKKSGGKRMIHAPERMLKFTQGRLLTRFFNQLEYPEHISAYVPGRSTRKSAELHANKPVLIVIDLKDFFPSTRRAWVRRAIQDLFGYPFAVANNMADLMTVPMDFPYGRRYVVPQGAPTSGAICNWVAHHRIDQPILEVCREWGMTYTRYADDLAFSSDKKISRKEANQFIKEISKIIKNGGYRVNRKKLRVVRKGRQQRLLGMTINEKPNIMRVHFRRMRARLHQCKTKGFKTVAKEMGLESDKQLKSQIEGQLSYYNSINPARAAQLQAWYTEAKNATPNQ